MLIKPQTPPKKTKKTYTHTHKGLLDGLGAVSIHPYRGENPDTVLSDYAQLRALIAQHGKTAAQKAMPIVSGEWGYTTAG